MGEFAKPGKIEQRYSRIGILRRRQVSTTETIAATRGPACSLPICIQLWRLCKDLHNAVMISLELGMVQIEEKIRIFIAR
jgi:hypothetical protein